jgi:enterochelin esterase-like enzyme
MRTDRAIRVACALALAASAAVMAAAQSGTKPAVPAARTGVVERVVVHGKSLEGNLEGDSPDRHVTVYLPPSYATDKNRRFAVLYLLPGYGGRDDMFTKLLANLAESADALAAAPGYSELIVVTPDPYTLHKGSMYSSSPTIGDWERFVAEDLVAYIDGHYRTLPDRRSRGLGGHSMGGYGAARIGMKRPDVFMALFLMSSCCLGANRDPRPDQMAAAAAITTRAQAEESARAPGIGPSVLLAQAAAWSPNPGNPPLFLDLPMKDGKVRPDIMAKWVANAPNEMVEMYAANLNRYYAVAIEIGTKDGLLRVNRELHDKLTRLHVAHAYEEYDGDHVNKLRERIGSRVLPFFARNLVAPLNPTSPVSPPK